MGRKDRGPGAGGHQGGNPGCPAVGTARKTGTLPLGTPPSPSTSLVMRFKPSPDLSSLAHRQSGGLDPLTGGTNEGSREEPYAPSPRDNEGLTCIKYTQASGVFHLQARKGSQTGQATTKADIRTTSLKGLTWKAGENSTGICPRPPEKHPQGKEPAESLAPSLCLSLMLQGPRLPLQLGP